MLKQFGFRFTAVDNAKGAFTAVEGGLGRVRQEADRTAGALGRSSRALLDSRNRMDEANRSSFNFRSALQGVGFQAADTAVMIEMGMDPMRAFIQQGSQMLAVFGTTGAILGGLVAVFGTLGIMAAKSGGDLEQLTSAAGVLTPMLSSIRDAALWTGSALVDFANLVVNNIDRIVVIAGTAAAMFATQWVVGFVAANVATMTLAGSLAFLRTAIIRTGIGALIVGAGELVFQFLRLMEGAGGFAEALRLLSAVALEVWDRIKQGCMAAGYAIAGVAYSIGAAFQEGLAWAVEGVGRLIDSINPLAPLLETMGISITGFTGGVAESLRASAETAGAIADSYGNSARIAADAAMAPIAAWQGVSDALDNVQRDTIDLRDLFGGAGDAAEEAGGKAEGAGKKAKNAADEAIKAWQEWLASVHDLGDSLAGSVGDGLMAITDGTKTAAEGFKDMARDIIKQLYDVMVVQRIVASLSNAITGNGAADGGLVGSIANAAGSSFQRRASGGDVRAGQTYWVNENSSTGAELFTPSVDGTITPNGKGGEAGVVVNNTYNLSLGVQQAVRQELAQHTAAMVEASKSAVRDAINRSKM